MKYFLAVGVTCFICITGFFLLTKGLKEENNWLCYEARSCVSDLEMTKQECQSRLDNSLDAILWSVNTENYDLENHNCLQYSQELQNKLKDVGIKSSIVKGQWGEQSHYWVLVWIEATKGEFIKPDSNYILEEIIE